MWEEIGHSRKIFVPDGLKLFLSPQMQRSDGLDSGGLGLRSLASLTMYRRSEIWGLACRSSIWKALVQMEDWELILSLQTINDIVLHPKFKTLNTGLSDLTFNFFRIMVIWELVTRTLGREYPKLFWRTKPCMCMWQSESVADWGRYYLEFWNYCHQWIYNESNPSNNLV